MALPVHVPPLLTVVCSKRTLVRTTDQLLCTCRIGFAVSGCQNMPGLTRRLAIAIISIAAIFITVRIATKGAS